MFREVVVAGAILFGTVSLKAQNPNPMLPSAADMSAVRAVVISTENGQEKEQEVKAGTLKSAGSAGMGKAVALGVLSFGFAGRPDLKYEAFGPSADVVCGAEVREIRLDGYDPKVMGANGTPVLIMAIQEDGQRVVRIRADGTGTINKANLKKVPKTKLVKAGFKWVIEVLGPLLPGNYLIITPNTPSFYWDFDVK